MYNQFYDIEGQKQREQQVCDLLIDYTIDDFDEYGNWISNVWPPNGPGLRERLWFASAYLAGGQKKSIELANAIIKTSKYAFCHFSPMAALQLLIKHGDKLDAEAAETLRSYLGNVLDDFKGGDLDFVGVNDNFPCMSTYTALFGGKLFDKPDLYDIGVKRLNQLKGLFSRRGVATEYTSPTYTPIHALAMAEIANYIDDETLRETALQCEERIWVDILGHYHPSTSQIAGPYSRAYTVDSTGHTHQARFILYALLGDKLPINPVNTLFASKDGERGEVIHGSAPFMQVSTTWFMGTYYHCPAYLVEAMLNKDYPFTFKATTEYGPSTDVPQVDRPKIDLSREDEVYEYPAGTGTVSTYMTQDYALGVSSNEFHCGVQTDSFHVLYRRRRPVRSQADVATVYARYIINDKKPGQYNYYGQFDAQVGDSLLWDQGRKVGIHHDNTAMMLYKPKIYGHKGVESLKLSLIFPAQYGPVEEIWLGDGKLNGPDGHSVEPCTVFVKDGPVYMAFHPLILTDCGREYAIKVEQTNDYVMVSLYNYEGPARDFPRRGFLLTGNGFVSEVRSEDEVGSFENFRDMMKDVKTSDELFTCMHWRWTYMRRTKYERDGLTMECEYSPASEGVKCVSINGSVSEAPKLKISGIDVDGLPFV
ncbi:hypothetical protein [Mahella australiensis]|uniref:Heparinase II/III family protein n=1 Tax=Mahella australiensis (strain DSM 15567 / CIP 107919 / 50-1 BON) TaxID=697281 RepID=F3ZX72_MAHA5|nr:hypothetical protein [Mahella australiensis]AEE96529.1 hypothetical protein Mahau_1335 [Mahella australiensis 50-1 BON]